MEKDHGNLRENSEWEGEEEEEEEEVVMASCSAELTRTDSGSVSLTANVFEDSSRLHAIAFPGPSAAWTDEKHQSYIRSLEASFVNRLHWSTSLYGLPSKRKSFRQQPANYCNSSQQSIVVRNGHRKEVSVQRVAHLLESTADSTDAFEKDQSQSSGGFVIGGNPTVYLARNPERSHAYGPSHEDSADDTAEGSDQNFVDEILSKSGRLAVAKRLKTVEVDCSISDQVSVDVLNTGQDACVR